MLGNAAIAAGLALLALAVGYLCRCPTLRHAAWLIVLLKLVTPPLFSISLPILPASWSAQPAVASSGRVIFPLSPSNPAQSLVGTAAPGASEGRAIWPVSVMEWVILVWA